MKHSSRAAAVDGASIVKLPNLKGGGTSHPADLVGTAEVVKPFMRDNVGRDRVGRLRLLNVIATSSSQLDVALTH